MEKPEKGKVRVHIRCGCETVPEVSNAEMGYTCSCPWCDEDLFAIETEDVDEADCYRVDISERVGGEKTEKQTVRFFDFNKKTK